MQPDFISMTAALQLQVPAPQMHHHVMNHSDQHSNILYKTSSSCKNYSKEEEKQGDTKAKVDPFQISTVSSQQQIIAGSNFHINYTRFQAKYVFL